MNVRMSCQENTREQDATAYESPSPETAGVIRGALRSIFRPTALFRKGAVGKLPMQKVGKLSESASQGIHLVTNITEAVSHEESQTTTNASSNKNLFYNLGTKSIAFTKCKCFDKKSFKIVVSQTFAQLAIADDSLENM